MKKTSIAAGLLIGASLAVSASASAEGLTGWYLGLNLGVDFQNDSRKTATITAPGGYFAASSIPAIAATGLQHENQTGFVGGGQGGYNWDVGNNWIIGVEADFDYTHSGQTTASSATYPCCAPTSFTIGSHVSSDWLATGRGKVGYSWGSSWLYGTGGIAFTNLHANFLFTDTFANAHESTSMDTTGVGWALGAGYEHMFDDNWSAGLQYLHVDFGSYNTASRNLTAFTPPIAFPANVFSHSASLREDIVRVEVNYHL
jgi:outer membrane immunogenic protein